MARFKVICTRCFLALMVTFTCPLLLAAQSRHYAGAVAGVSVLSADAQTLTRPDTVAVSLYRPFNGAAVNAFAGRDVSEFVTVQGNYVWNRNRVSVFATEFTGGRQDLREEERRTSQHAALGDVLLYFRNRGQWARPYLSAGAGVVRIESQRQQTVTVRGTSSELPSEFAATRPAFRVAVGIDVALGPGWAFRYTFSETIQRNPLSERLSPPGQRSLANFQNLFGLVKRF